MINCVETQYTQEYIANVFWRQHIAKVSSITLIPYLKNGCVYNIAYITIENWCESENAYNFMRRLNDPSKEARIVYQDDNWWPIEINTHNNGELNAGVYTTVFTDEYFENNEPEKEEEQEEELDDLREQRPIMGLDGVYYSVSEAQEHLMILKKGLISGYRLNICDDYLDELEAEREHLENELQIHHSVENSKNVTLREHQKFPWAVIHPEISCKNM